MSNKFRQNFAWFAFAVLVIVVVGGFWSDRHITHKPVQSTNTKDLNHHDSITTKESSKGVSITDLASTTIDIGLVDFYQNGKPVVTSSQNYAWDPSNRRIYLDRIYPKEGLTSGPITTSLDPNRAVTFICPNLVIDPLPSEVDNLTCQIIDVPQNIKPVTIYHYQPHFTKPIEANCDITHGCPQHSDMIQFPGLMKIELPQNETGKGSHQ